MKKINLRRKSLIIAALLAAVSVGAGTAGTVAFFQSNHSFDITVEAATVDVEQRVPTIMQKSLQYESDEAKVEVDDKGNVNANLLVPGDSFIIHSTYVNNSTISIKYRIRATASKGLTAEYFTDAYCTVVASDSSYTRLAAKGEIADHYIKVTATDDLENGATGKVTVGVEAVQSNAYVDVATSDDLKTKLAAGGSLDLGANLSIETGSVAYAVKENTILDLNGKTLTIDGSAGTGTGLSVEEGKTLTLKDGNVVVKGKGLNVAALQCMSSTLVLDNVNYKSANGTGVMYSGSGSHMTIKDSTLDVDGYFGVSTNANSMYKDQSDSTVDISGSTITVTNAENDNCGILFNVGGKYNITDSTINAQRQGIMVRSGDLTLNNVTINKTYDYVNATRDGGKFSSGDEVPQAALFLGNGDSGNYTAPSKVTFAGQVNFTGVGPKIVASGSTTQDVDLETGKYYTGDVKVYDFREEGDTHTFTINGQAIAIGTYGHAGTDTYTI